MENFEQRWIDVEFLLKERFGKLPDMEGTLFLIGVNELGKLPRKNSQKSKSKTLCMWRYVRYSASLGIMK